MAWNTIPLITRLERHIKVMPNGCWEWQGRRSRDGYGRMTITESRRPHTRPAHRVAWEHFNGPIPENMLVCHKCDNPPCINPAHLFLGTHRDNFRDMREKGRSATGSRNT